jgi:SAM-dependent methyltransferase
VEGYDELFGGDDYLWFWEPLLTDERSDREAELVWRLLGLEPGLEVLDLACGHGRIANRLAARGARVTGLDRSARFLERARTDAAALGVEVEYVEGDMRALPWRNRFDAVLNWFSAFGYFDDDAVLRGILRGVCETLKPGGRFAMDAHDPALLMRRFRETAIHERDGDFLLERVRWNLLRGGADTEFVAVRGGERRRYSLFVRTPGYTELRGWLLDAGFSRVDGFGEDGEPLHQEHRRMVVVAHA